MIHFLNTGLAPLFTPINDLSFANDNLLAARALYHSSYLTEGFFVFGALVVHVTSGAVLRVARIVRERLRYGRAAKYPYLSWNAIAGYIIAPMVAAHSFSTRIIPFKLDLDVTASLVGHLITRSPLIGWSFYLSMVALSSYHIVMGIGQWRGWTNKVKQGASVGIASFWVAGLIKVGLHGLVSGFTGKYRRLMSSAHVTGRNYDIIYENLVSTFRRS